MPLSNGGFGDNAWSANSVDVPQNDFFSTIASGIGTGISRVFSDILPRWTAQQVIDQQSNPYVNPLYDSRYSGFRLDSQGRLVPIDYRANVTPTGSTIFGIRTDAIVIGAVALIGLLLVIRS